MSIFNRGVDGITIIHEVTFSQESKDQLEKLAEVLNNLVPELYVEVYGDSSISSISITEYTNLNGEKENY